MYICTFGFYPNGQLALITVIAESAAHAERLVREMIGSRYFDDGLFMNDFRPYDNPV